MSDIAELVRELRSFAEAYPKSVFEPISDNERKLHSVLISRASAAMGRHFAKWATQSADALEAQAKRIDLFIEQQERLIAYIQDQEQQAITSTVLATRRITELENALRNIDPASRPPRNS